MYLTFLVLLRHFFDVAKETFYVTTEFLRTTAPELQTQECVCLGNSFTLNITNFSFSVVIFWFICQSSGNFNNG